MIGNRLKFVLIVIAGLMLNCGGCDRKAEPTGKEADFEIVKDYQRGPLTVYLKISKTKISIAETLDLQLEASIKTGYELAMPKIDATMKDFGIRDWRNLGDTLDENGNIARGHYYRLEPFLSGTYPIPGFTFEFYDVNEPDEKRHELVTEPIDIEVSSLLGEDRAQLVIADIENVVELPSQPSLWWLWLVGIIVISGAILLWLRYKRRRIIEMARIFRPAHEIAYARLQALVNDNLIEAGRIKEFYERISNILRYYIENRFELHAPERTTEEFLPEMQETDVLSENDKQDLAEFLSHCDMVKFAKLQPSTEQIQRTFDLVKSFIEKTKSQEKQIDVTESVQPGQTVEVGSQ